MQQSEPDEIWRPTYTQELLLKSALLDGSAAKNSWNAFKRSTDIEQLDASSQRLLPLVYDNLKKIGFEDSLTKKLKSVYRKTWYQNQIFIHHLGQLLHQFYLKGIEVMILKGAALTLLYYKNHALRPMEDLDILVHQADVISAMDLMQNMGWSSTIPLKRSLNKAFLVSRSRIHLQNAIGCICDLNWNLLKMSIFQDDMHSFWSNAIKIRMVNTEALILNPEDQLLHILKHATDLGYLPNIRWVADVWIILQRQADAINWHRFIDQIERYSLGPYIKNLLPYLQTTFGVPFPDGLIKRVALTVSSKIGIKYHKTTHKSPYISRQLYAFYWLFYFQFRQQPKAERRFPRDIFFILEGLQARYNIRYGWQVPFILLKRILRHLFLNIFIKLKWNH